MRRVIGADSARTDPVLAPLIISQVGTTNGDYGKVVTFSSPQSRASAGGYKMIYQRPKQNAIPTCYRVGTAPTVQSVSKWASRQRERFLLARFS